MLRLNKVLIAILLLSVFAVGTLSFVDTVEAAKWKKFDSGKYKIEPVSGYKDTASFVSYSKGSKDLKMNIYWYKTKNNKKEYQGTAYFSKSGNKIKMYSVDKKGKKSKPEYGTYKGTIKQFYKEMIYEIRNS